MKRALVVVVAIVAACGGSADDAARPATSWRFVSLSVDGEPVPLNEPLFLDIFDDGRFSASTSCNDVGGEFGGELGATDMGCDPARTEVEQQMTAAFRTEPDRNDDRLVFDTGEVRLVYEAFTDPRPEQLFSVLGDPDAAVDRSELPPEEVTGTVPPDFEALAALPSPSPDIELYLAVLDGNVCLTYTTTTAIDKTCDPPRFAAARSFAHDIPFWVRPVARVALIPDAFASTLATRDDLGDYDSNILTLRADVPPGDHLVTNDAGDRLLLSVPVPWEDPLAASTTTEPAR